jgi:hypothetical protein
MMTPDPDSPTPSAATASEPSTPSESPSEQRRSLALAAALRDGLRDGFLDPAPQNQLMRTGSRWQLPQPCAVDRPAAAAPAGRRSRASLFGCFDKM